MLMGMQIGKDTKENSMEVPQNIKLPYDLAIPLLDKYLKEMKETISKRHLHPYVQCSISYNNQYTETNYLSINR